MCLDYCSYARSFEDDDDFGTGPCGLNPVTIQDELKRLRAAFCDLEESLATAQQIICSFRKQD